ncbi:phosphoribosylformylglycinamidine synthase subunit PurL [Campylobacter sp. 19-13652]|uniref:phosphoribosylformylglycinamidine synthase subunit PurL n=1 Tax=Campylobacter sp. 19-13652 TaxID=2840180 RepID=UPI001C77F27D|nr:phosphoribosylformylglycinamidine synthase subunit PurL [Campylobacter sp. 19-13652]BCX79542.1 phosphoribosylformylglycinamidine synthase subunit PurL [Campylobacter sp. 19-13652]
MTKDVVKAHKISEEEYLNILNILGREPNLLELGVFSAMWSEHCSYKSSRKYLRGFPTSAPWVIQGPGENAGVIDIGGGYAAVFKVESHNHPSFIEPFAGAATGVGGILRDIFTMGARCVANINSLRFGNIKGDSKSAKYQRHLLKGVANGISHYGNCMGIPMVAGETSFDESFDGNILVNAFALGVCKSDEIFYAKAEGVGNPVIYVGSKTGRDGLGGAVMASDSFNEASKSLRPTVQVGDPFAEKLLMEACLELFKHDYIVGIQDMGAAGLTSSSFEMAGRSGSGMRLELDKVPMREEGMTPYELMLSESQERMLICAKKGYEGKVIELFKRYGLDAAVVGEVTDSGIMQLIWHGEIAGEIPIAPLSEAAPVLDRPVKEATYLNSIKDIKLNKSIPTNEAFRALLKDENILDKAYIYEQYDSTVGANTIKPAGSLGAGALRVRENGRYVAMASECNTRACYVSPFNGAALAVATAGRKVAAAGAMPLAITDCLNYGNPEDAEVMWQFKMGCEGIKEACSKLNTPVVSGNVSLYNQTDGVSIQPTPTIVSVGAGDGEVTPSFITKENIAIYLLGKTSDEFGASLYLKNLYGEVGGEVSEIDFSYERALWEVLVSAKSNLEFANSVGVGGVAMTLAKMSAYGGVGVNLKSGFGDERLLFSESASRAIVGVKDEALFLSTCKKFGVEATRLGVSGGDKFILDSISMDLCELRDVYFNEFKRLIKG